MSLIQQAPFISDAESLPGKGVRVAELSPSDPFPPSLPPQASEVAAEIKRKSEKKQRKKLKQEKKRLEALAAAAEAAVTHNSSLLESPEQVGLLPSFLAGWGLGVPASLEEAQGASSGKAAPKVAICVLWQDAYA